MHDPFTRMQPTLEEERLAFAQQRLLAMPIAGIIAWFVIGVAGAILPVNQAALTLLVVTGMIFPLGLLVARFTGEDLLGRSRKGNRFDQLFLSTILMSFLVFGIAIPFIRIDVSAAPLAVGILAGLMWIPLSWIIQHWIGYLHGISRTLLIVVAWYLFPAHRFVVIPAIIVLLYFFSLSVLWKRKRPSNPKPITMWREPAD
ncbi:MAG: DUF7010 family protein [Gammaproteobacteria bacterium]